MLSTTLSINLIHSGVGKETFSDDPRCSSLVIVHHNPITGHVNSEIFNVMYHAFLIKFLSSFFRNESRFGTQPWMNRHYVVNNFEHRYMAQQKALKEQQEQIKEQRRMIEELKFQQNKEKLKQQLKMPTPVSSDHGGGEIEGEM